jgi:hypothetical protein
MKRHLHRKYPGLHLIPGIVLAIIILAIASLLYGIYLQLAAPKTTDGPIPLRITEASLIINDPEMRGLSYEAETISTTNSNNIRYLIRDKNQSFYDRCGYAVAIWPISDEAARQVQDGSDEAAKLQYKQVDERWYRVWLGTYWQSECAGAIDEDDTYILDLQDYVLENLVKAE